ncbi:MAG: DOMON domain-containing protein [Alphaproteobacteria bacterium]
MTKREFLTMALTALSGFTLTGLSANAATSHDQGSVSAAGVTFQWRHESGRLRANLSAPTAGWIAVGFNENPTLENTRFVIAAVSVAPIRVEEHIAMVPDHREVSQLGLPAAIAHTSGSYRDGISRLEFSLPEAMPGRARLSLRPGAKIHLMLAWSQETDFDHHSAWRRHFDITL